MNLELIVTQKLFLALRKNQMACNEIDYLYNEKIYYRRSYDFYVGDQFYIKAEFHRITENSDYTIKIMFDTVIISSFSNCSKNIFHINEITDHPFYHSLMMIHDFNERRIFLYGL